jgi:cyclase
VLKKRIIPVQLLLNNRLVKTKNFDEYRDVGDPVSSSRVYNSQYADELIFLNIDKNATGIEPLEEILESVSEVCFMPLAVGGGIRNYKDAATLIKRGADKVVLNTICYDNPQIISEIADNFGNQAVIVAIDVKKNPEGYSLYSNCGQTIESVLLEEHCNNCINAGAGEILIQSIDQDGSMQGFDLELMRYIKNIVNIPIIALGGAGNYLHLRDVFLKSNVSAVACGSLFNFSDSNLIRAKAFLSNYNLDFKVV